MTSDANKTSGAAKHWTEYVFFMLVGSMYIYALTRVIISATFISVTDRRLFVMGAASLAFFAVIFYNRVTRIITAVVVTLGAFFLFFTFERWETQFEHLYDVSLMVRGYLMYSPELGNTVLWAICVLFGLVVAVFMLYRFSFYLLGITGVAIFLFTWGPGFTRDATSFLIFLVCFCLLLVRKTNRGISAVYVAAPICVALVIFIQGSVPVEAELFRRRALRELFEGPLVTVGDFIYVMTNPMYFSFQSTGFSGQGGRLGGPVTPNNRNVMTVRAPGRTYLAGATHNTYTGYSWITTLEPGQLYTQGMIPGQFEMLETTTALIRGASHVSESSFLTTGILRDAFPVDDSRFLAAGRFRALGILDGDGGIFFDDHFAIRYMHTYLPMEEVTIAIGTNRTGTVFRPVNARDMAFHPAGNDYLPVLAFYPSGDMRAPGFMARGTQYSLEYLNVNHRLTFVQELLNNSFAGIYAEPIEYVFYSTLNYLWPELYDYFLSHNPDDYLCNLTYATVVYIYENVGDSELNREFRIRYPKALLGIVQHNISVTAEDMSDLFDMYAFLGPGRELQYLYSHSLLNAKLDSFERDVLAVYAETVREHFMHVPEIVPQRVHDLVAELTYGLETDYERIMAIRDYLITFTYTFTPQPVPPGVCFVDHFLFVGQEGYCTYYASAMAVMSRIAGVPSRYVEGFLLPPAPPESEDGIAIFVVTNMMAHAWVEVYLEGFGWLIVEATAPYAFFMDQTLTFPQGNFQPGWFGDDWWDYMDYYHDMMFGGIGGFGGAGTGAAGFGAEGAEVATGGMRLELVRVMVLAAFAIVALAVLGFLLSQYVRVLTTARRINRLPINQRITTYFAGILAIASHVTSAKDPAETAYSYGQRVGMRFAFKNDSARLRDLVALYYKAKFGSRQLSDVESDIMKESYFDMVNYLRVENNKTQFFYLRYILRVGAV